MSITQIFENMRTGRVEARTLTNAEIYGNGAALPAPEPVPASVQLRRNLERASATYTNRENVLLQEIEARQAELADVRKAKGAVDTALIDLHVSDELASSDGVDASTGLLIPRARLREKIEKDPDLETEAR